MEKLRYVTDIHDLKRRPVFIQKDGKIMGLIKRSDFNYLYPIGTDRIEDFEKCPHSLRLTDIAFYLESLGYNLVTE